MGGKFEQDLDKTAANHAPLTPLSFIERAAAVYPHRPAVIDGARRFTWAQTYARCRRLASALSRWGIGFGDTVAVVLPNITAMYEAHFGVPMCGAALNAINIRLNAEAIAFMLEHGEAKLLIADTEFADTVEQALKLLKKRIPVIDVEDAEFQGGRRLGEVEYEAFIETGDPDFAWRYPEDEWEASGYTRKGWPVIGPTESLRDSPTAPSRRSRESLQPARFLAGVAAVLCPVPDAGTDRSPSGRIQRCASHIVW